MRYLPIRLLVTTLFCITLAAHTQTARVYGQAAGKTPNAPITGKFSVQWFLGGTKNCMISFYPPLNYTDGSLIPAGVEMKAKFYRSYDGGKTYAEKGVKLIKQEFVDFTNPVNGQNRFDPARISWLNCTLETPVDPPRNDAIELLGQRPDGATAQKDTTVYLAVSIEVNGVESERTNRFLTFSYATGGIPGLTRFEKPDADSQPIAAQLAQVPSQVLADKRGLWEGNYLLTTYSIPDEVRNSDAFREQGCQDAIRQIEAALGREIPLKVTIKSIVPDDGYGEQGNVSFPGTGEVAMANLNDSSKFTNMKADVVYYRMRSVVILEAKTEQGVLQMVGHVLENPTHYEIHGPMKFRFNNEGKDLMILHGMWTVRRTKL